ncbi:hypothetical protein OHA18_33510 [Kribbella sp. NBC_00709]|uniref:hypothetical protein n=1 Tax=Kribbella sp. NBC_00709 TaxID=2975972 RepID=UPI002E27F249|nr:hypothetical protein [Kribbella sp. NBC_00709]
MSTDDYDPPYAIARTPTEVALYLDLTPCPDCGSDQADWRDRLTALDDEPVLIYTGNCADCGALREYVFSPPPGPSPGPFGGLEPSELIDACQWLTAADRIAGQVAADDRSESARTVMTIARQAVEEVVKFIPPSEDAVPDEAFWTDAGRAERALDPGRFRLDRLLVIRDSYASV